MVLYAAVVPHGEQAVSPTLENCCAGHVRHVLSLVVVQVDTWSHTVPAGQVVVQARQGAVPVTFQVTPETHSSWHV